MEHAPPSMDGTPLVACNRTRRRGRPQNPRRHPSVFEVAVQRSWNQTKNQEHVDKTYRYVWRRGRGRGQYEACKKNPSCDSSRWSLSGRSMTNGEVSEGANVMIPSKINYCCNISFYRACLIIFLGTEVCAITPGVCAITQGIFTSQTHIKIPPLQSFCWDSSFLAHWIQGSLSAMNVLAALLLAHLLRSPCR